jgi:hypothetical protein
MTPTDQSVSSVPATQMMARSHAISATYLGCPWVGVPSIDDATNMHADTGHLVDIILHASE